jgi:hypothetical protein
MLGKIFILLEVEPCRGDVRSGYDGEICLLTNGEYRRHKIWAKSEMRWPGAKAQPPHLANYRNRR